jgi:hypothetical protein
MCVTIAVYPYFQKFTEKFIAMRSLGETFYISITFRFSGGGTPSAGTGCQLTVFLPPC